MQDYTLKVAILNDLHPYDSPGAASIALRLASTDSFVNNSEFWCSSRNSVSYLSKKSGSVKLGVFDPGNRSRSGIRNKLNEYVDIKAIYWVAKNYRRFKPDVVWTHQIGNVFPRFLLIYFRIMRVPVYSTLHDFSLIVPRKLYPSDFESYDYIDGVTKLGKFCPFETGFSFIYLHTRQILNKYLYNWFSSVICISNMQREIYQNFDFRILSVISNGVDICDSKHDDFEQSQEKINLLFVGRSPGKGFHFCLTLTKSNPKFHLLLVGGDELLEEASTSLAKGSFTYFGKLETLDLRHVYHLADYVLVLSECFDVYPGVLMEALSHGCKVLTTASVGNSALGHADSLSSIIRNQDELLNFGFRKSARRQALTLPSHSQIAELYSRKFHG